MREKLNLSGEWILLVDPEDAGTTKKWYIEPPLSSGEKVNIPLTQPPPYLNRDTKFWFIKRFDLDSSWINPHANVLLTLAYINFHAEIWINGQQLEPHFGAFTKFRRTLSTSLLKEKDNLLAICVDPLSNTSQSVLFNRFSINGWEKFPGIWGEVTLEKVPNTYIESIYIKSDLKNKRVVINIYPNTKNIQQFRVKISELGLETESKKPKITIPLQDFEKWTLENPKLYTLSVKLDGENESDEVTSKFGIRDLSIIDGNFYFNFQQIILKSVYFDWSPNHLTTKDFSVENLRKYLTALKDAGFNSILSIGKPLPERILQICDEIGLLVGESTSFIHSHELENYNLYFELKEIFYHHRNHPSFVWFIINTLAPEESIPQLIREIRKIDRVRVLTINKDFQNSTRTSVSCTPFTIEPLPTKIITLRPWSPVNENTLLWIESFNAKNTLQFILSYDFVNLSYSKDSSPPIKGKILSELERGFNERDLALSFQSAEKMLENAKLVYIANYNSIIQSIRKNQSISGYCLFRLSLNKEETFDNLLFHLNTEDGVKQTLRRYNQNIKMIIQLGKTNLTPLESTSIDVTLTYPENSLCPSQEDINKLAEVLLQITSPTQQTLWKKKKFVKLKKDLTELYSADISASTATGTHVLTGKFLINKIVVSETNKSFYVAPLPRPTECIVEIVDPYKNFTKICLKWVKKISPLAPIIILPPIANTVFAYPDNELTMMLNSIKEGAIGIVFSPPHDWNQITQIISDCPKINIQSIEDYPNSTVFHYVKPHPVFINLPTRQLMRLPYRNVIGKTFFLDKSDEDATGCIVISNSDDSVITWGTTFLILRYGVGRIVFTTLRILENLEGEPVAQHIFVNMLNHLSRRAIPLEKPSLPIPNAVEFIRHKRNTSLRKWIIGGPFPNDAETQSSLNIPIEKLSKFEVTLETIFGKSLSKIWFTSEKDSHKLDFHHALDIQTYTHHLEELSFSAFAYGEFFAPHRLEAIIQVETPNLIQIWINDCLIIENLSNPQKVNIYEAKVNLKHSKNTVLVRCAKEKGPSFFSINFYDTDRKKLNIIWSN